MANGRKPSGKRSHSSCPRKFPWEVLFVQKTFRWTIFPVESSRYLTCSHVFTVFTKGWENFTLLSLITALKIWRTASPRGLSSRHNWTKSCKSTWSTHSKIVKKSSISPQLSRESGASKILTPRYPLQCLLLRHQFHPVSSRLPSEISVYHLHSTSSTVMPTFTDSWISSTIIRPELSMSNILKAQETSSWNLVRK